MFCAPACLSCIENSSARLQEQSSAACPILLLLADNLEVSRASLPQCCSAQSFSHSQPLATPVILAAEPLPMPAASQAPPGSQDKSHTNAHTIMWSAATQRVVIGCNEVKGSSSRYLLRILTLSSQAEQIQHCSMAIGDEDIGCLTSPLLEVGTSIILCRSVLAWRGKMIWTFSHHGQAALPNRLSECQSKCAWFGMFCMCWKPQRS